MGEISNMHHCLRGGVDAPDNKYGQKSMETKIPSQLNIFLHTSMVPWTNWTRD